MDVRRLSYWIILALPYALLPLGTDPLYYVRDRLPNLGILASLCYPLVFVSVGARYRGLYCRAIHRQQGYPSKYHHHTQVVSPSLPRCQYNSFLISLLFCFLKHAILVSDWLAARTPNASFHILLGPSLSPYLLMCYSLYIKVFVFYAIRGALALFSAYCETIFCIGISKAFKSSLILVGTMIFLAFSTGMFISSSGLLNSCVGRMWWKNKDLKDGSPSLFFSVPPPPPLSSSPSLSLSLVSPTTFALCSLLLSYIPALARNQLSAFLPSSFAMYLCTLALGYWLQYRLEVCYLV